MKLRERRRLETRRLVQRVATDLCADADFQSITVARIARESGVSESTIFRLFTTKEAIITWDERDAVFEAEIVRRLGKEPVVHAFLRASQVAFADRDDLEAYARRLRLVYTDDRIGAASIEAFMKDREELIAGYAALTGRREATLADEVVVSACAAALEAALGHWAARPALSLHDVLAEAFAALGPLAV